MERTPIGTQAAQAAQAVGAAVEPGTDSRRLPLDFPDDDSMRISHEAIYQALTCKAGARCAAS
jgi:hypothetical protein